MCFSISLEGMKERIAWKWRLLGNVFLEESCRSYCKFSKCFVYGIEWSIGVLKERVLHSSSVKLGFKFELFDLILYFSVFFFGCESQTDEPALIVKAQWTQLSVVAKCWGNGHSGKAALEAGVMLGTFESHFPCKTNWLCWQMEKNQFFGCQKVQFSQVLG